MLSPAPWIHYYRTQDGSELTTRVWEVEDPLASVVYLHGIVSHGGWYLSSCAHLAKQRFEVHLLERRGSGLNLHARGDVKDWTQWLSDVENYLDSLPAERARILLGISWGGILAAAIARHGRIPLGGIGLLCPGLFSKKGASFVQRSALRLSGVLGLNSLRVTIPLQDPSLFTNSEPDQRYIASDPLSLRKITLRFARANQALLHYATEEPVEIRVPVLLMLAGRDAITDNPRVRQFVDRIGHESKTVIEYPDASHTLEFEKDPSQYFQDLANWCRNLAVDGQHGPLVTPQF